VATGGVGAGHCRIFAGGPSSQLTLGVSGQDRLTVSSTNVDVTGSLEVDALKLNGSPVAGYVLTSDSSGNATWQAPTGSGGITLPYEDSVDSTLPGFKITNDNMYNLSTGSLGEQMTGVEGRASSFEGTGVAGHNDHFGSVGKLGQGKYGVYGVSARSDGAGGHFSNTGGGPALVASGTVKVGVLQIMGGADISEQFDVKSDESQVEPGMVVCIDPGDAGKLVVSESAYDHKVAGIVSGAGGIATGMMMGQQDTVADGAYPVALTGRVYVWADASGGPIEPGDLLTTSDVPGHAMKVSDYDKAHGATLGKAMTSLDAGRGLVLVLVSLQ
jgi:hypothetical protein